MNEKIVVGVSGGADSVALLFFLREERGAENIFAAHVNHNLRGDESIRDENFVRELCEKIGVALKIFHVNVKKFAETCNFGIEEAARKLRYDALEKARVEFCAQKIAVGHNADDNAETVLMNLCRGSGLKGLCGIPPENGKIIRPFLSKSRAEIEEFLRARQIEFIHDSSNFSDDFMRNRVRNIIFPMLEREINPNVRSAIARTAEILRDDEDFLAQSAQRAVIFEELSQKKRAERAVVFEELSQQNNRRPENEISCEENIFPCEEKNISCDAKTLSAAHPAMQKRAIRAAIERVRGDLRDITYAHVVAVLQLANAHSGREIHLPGLVVSKEYEKILFRKNFSPQQKYFHNFKIKISETPPNFDAEHCTKAFAYDKITQEIILRTRKNGDKISFLHGEKFFTKKLQDFFTDKKIPKSERENIPLVAHGNEILWILLPQKNFFNAKFEARDDEKKLYVTILCE